MIINPFEFELDYPAGRIIDYDPASDFYSALSDGTGITTVKDISGNANDGTAGTAFLPNIDRSHLIAGLPTFFFANDHGGSNLTNKYYWVLPDLSAISGSNGGTAFCIYKLAYDPTTMNERGSGLWHFGTDTAPDVVPYQDGNIYDGFGSDARHGFSSGGNSGYNAQFLVYAAKSKTNDFKAWRNGTQLYSTSTNTVAFNSAPRLGNNIPAFDSYFFGGWMARFIFFTPALSDAESISFAGQLIAKYGL